MRFIASPPLVAVTGMSHRDPNSGPEMSVSGRNPKAKINCEKRQTFRPFIISKDDDFRINNF